MSKIVISQPMYFPWVGMFEQVCLADTFVFLDDAQFARGFINRVQYKTDGGSKWMTIPLKKHSQKTQINEVELSDDNDWRAQHTNKFSSSIALAPYADDAINLMSAVLGKHGLTFSDLVIESMLAVMRYFEIENVARVLKSSDMNLSGKKGDLIKEIVTQLEGSRYITGMGGLNYLDHEGFEESGIAVEYMDYNLNSYPQVHGDFTPYVTILDLIANCGKGGREYINSGTISWRDALASIEGK